MIRRGLWRHLGSTVRALWLCDWMWMYLDWKMPQYCAGGWICSRVVCENTIVCVCVCRGAERTLYMTPPPPPNLILLPPISLLLFPNRRRWSPSLSLCLRVFTHPSVSSSSLLSLVSAAPLFLACFPGLHPSLLTQEVTSLVEGCLCARGRGAEAMWRSIAAEDIREYRFSRSELNLVSTKTCFHSTTNEPHQHQYTEEKTPRFC